MFNTAQVVVDKIDTIFSNQRYKNRFLKHLDKFVGHPLSFVLVKKIMELIT